MKLKYIFTAVSIKCGGDRYLTNPSTVEKTTQIKLTSELRPEVSYDAEKWLQCSGKMLSSYFTNGLLTT